MIFSDALLKMVDGARVRRKGSVSHYFCIMPGQDFVWKVLEHFSPPKVFDYTPSIEDLLASDWEVIK